MEKTEWRPIETAPRDGTRVLLLHVRVECEVMLGYWDEQNDGWETDSEWWPDADFSHWMPLPNPPE